jgi:hypothetical protein
MRSRLPAPIVLTLTHDEDDYVVPMKCAYELLQAHRELLDTRHYAVQSRVSPDIFEAFVIWLAWQRDEDVAPEHAEGFLELAREFRLPSLVCEGRDLLRPPAAEGGDCPGVDLLATRMGELERSLSAALSRIGDLEAALGKSAASAVSPLPDCPQPDRCALTPGVEELSAPVVPFSP